MYIGCVDRAGQKQPGLKDRLTADDPKKVVEFHAHNLPQLVSCCYKQGSECSGREYNERSSSSMDEDS